MRGKKIWRWVRIAAAMLCLAVFIFLFSGRSRQLTVFAQSQLGPALLQSRTAFSAGALAVILAIFAGTVLFGRFYCAVLCPWGILQDIIGWLSCRPAQLQPDYRRTRYAVAGVAYGMLLAGLSGGFYLLDPYSNFGRLAVSFSLGGLLPLVVIIVLVLWKKRLYCTVLCPVGTLLGLLARHSIFRLVLTEQCVHCGKCVNVCPSGCIDPEAGILDNERCVRCLNCLSCCPTTGVSFRFMPAGQQNTAPALSPSRRSFVLNGAVLLSGLAAGAVLAKAGLSKLGELPQRLRILPPGAGDAGRFAAKCTGCQLCVACCPGKIIKTAPQGIGPVQLDLSDGYCRYGCHNCARVCPTGAISALGIAVKKRTKIAEVHFLPWNCIVLQEGRQCGRCAEACPTQAITLRRSGAPKVDQSRCIGCGACQAVCPASDKAMQIRPIERQRLLSPQ